MLVEEGSGEGVVDIVLGVSADARSVRTVLLDGEDGDGITVDQDIIPVRTAADVAERVVSAIVAAQRGAGQGGYRLSSTGVAVGDRVQAGALRSALADSRVHGVTLVSTFLAAAALTQTVGAALGYRRTALLFVEPRNATLAVVDSADGTTIAVCRVLLPADDAGWLAELAAIAAGAATSTSHPDGIFVVGSGVNVGAVTATLAAASPIPLSVPENPETSLARGAALAGAHAPLLESSTSALAWARDPGTGVVGSARTGLRHGESGFAECGDESARYEVEPLAYSAVGGDDAVEYPDFGAAQTPGARRPFLLAGSALVALFVAGVTALVLAVAVGVQPTASSQPSPGGQLTVPARQALLPPAPLPNPIQAPVRVPAPVAHRVPAPAPAPAPDSAPAPAVPAAVPAPEVPAAVPAPEVPAAVPAPEVPVPALQAPLAVPQAPAPPPGLPIPIPIPIPIPALIPLPALAPAPARAPVRAPVSSPAPAPAPVSAPGPVPGPAQVAPPSVQPVTPRPPVAILPPILHLPTKSASKSDAGSPGVGGENRDARPGQPRSGGTNRGGLPAMPGSGGSADGDSGGFRH